MTDRINKIDLGILLPVLVLIAFSLGVVYSASSSWSVKMSGDSSYLFKNHLLRAGFGVFLIFLFSRIDYRHLINIRKYLMIIALAMLIYLLFSKIIIKGASRWIIIGGLSFQPADFVKYALIVNLSYLLMKKKDYLKSLYYAYIPLVTYVILITTLIALQPNFSTAVIILISSMMLFFIAKVQFKHLLFTFISIVPVAFLYVVSKPYILNRLFSFSEHTSGGDANYQLSQAIIGFGNGSLFGVGPGNSNQREFFLPQSYDDFIFSIVGEEYGFIGVTLVLLMFSIFVYRGLKLSKTIDDDFGKYLSFGFTSIIGLHAVVNMMVSTGIVPTTGITLPFMSYGGTSIVFNSIAVGFLLNISTFRLKPVGIFWREQSEQSSAEL
ncbi:MAG: FtsW/RodA/SpoVE family cell cycle protein [Ignavibacteria bacterium]